MPRVVVADDPSMPLVVTVYAGDARVDVPVSPLRALALAGQLIEAAGRRLRVAQSMAGKSDALAVAAPCQMGGESSAILGRKAQCYRRFLAQPQSCPTLLSIQRLWPFRCYVISSHCCRLLTRLILRLIGKPMTTDKSAETTREKQRGKPWPKGVSGNPAGRPTGSRHKAALAAEALFDGDAERLSRKAIEMALDGDGVALRLCLDRICPPRRERAVCFALPALETASDAPRAMAGIVQAVAVGDLTASEAADLAALIERFVKIIETSELEARIKAIEERNT